MLAHEIDGPGGTDHVIDLHQLLLSNTERLQEHITLQGIYYRII
jgi:hypothetical protein